MRAIKGLLQMPVGLLSATLMWVMAVAWPILLVMSHVLIPALILYGLVHWMFDWGGSIEGWIPWIGAALVAGAALMMADTISAPAVRFSLRLAPLPLGRRAAPWPPAMLVRSWIACLAAFRTADAVVIGIAVGVGLLGIWKSWDLRRRWHGEPEGDFVLFLRRFGRSADRSVGTAVRNAVPPGAALVFLTGARAGGASWDPFLVGFDGLLGWDPKSIPLYLQARDEEWVEQVRRMVARARLVIFDATDWSPAMETEAAILRQAGAAERCLVLVRHAGDAGPSPVPARRTIHYRRTWRGTLQRVFWGLLFVAFIPQLLLHGEALPEEPDPAATLVLGAAGVWMFLRRLMDAGSLQALKDEVAAAVAPPG